MNEVSYSVTGLYKRVVTYFSLYLCVAANTKTLSWRGRERTQVAQRA